MAKEEKYTPVTWMRSLDKETDSPVQGILSGKIPGWLQGTLIRNGPGVHELGDSRMEYLFDGLSVLHRFNIRDGRATYQNRILKSRTYLEGVKANRLTLSQFGTFAHPDPCKSLLGKLMSRFEPMTAHKITDNCNVNVCCFGDKVYALTESTLVREIDPDTLDTIGDQLNVTDFVAVNHCTAHPHVDDDGTVYNMGTSYGSKGMAYNLVQFPPGQSPFTRAKVVASFPVRWKMSSSYYHSFGMTENYFVFVESPLVINVCKFLMSNFQQVSLTSALKWLPKERPRILLVERKTGKRVRQIYETPVFMAFHHGNAYEKDGHIIMDICTYPNANIVTELNLENVINESSRHTLPHYTRYVIPLNVTASEKRSASDRPSNLNRLKGFKGKSYWLNKTTIMCEPECLMAQNFELPRINDRFNGRPYRFVYGAFLKEETSEGIKILKLNVETKEVKEWTKRGYVVSEPIFVARPGSTEEDDGCILFSALDTTDVKKVLLVILNASTFQEEATVEFKTSGIVPKDFHGMFSRDEESLHAC